MACQSVAGGWCLTVMPELAALHVCGWAKTEKNSSGSSCWLIMPRSGRFKQVCTGPVHAPNADVHAAFVWSVQRVQSVCRAETITSP